MTTPAEIMDETLQRITEHPENWQQWTYNACFAHHAVEVAVSHGFTPNPELHVSQQAREVLAISFSQEAILFTGGNTLDDLRKITTAIKRDNASGNFNSGQEYYAKLWSEVHGSQSEKDLVPA